MPLQQPPLTYLIILAALALVIFRNLRPQTMTIARLWLMPVILMLLVGVSFWATAIRLPPSALWLPAVAILIGLAIGIPFGIVRGQHSKLRAGPKPGTIVVEPSTTTLILFFVAFAVRYAIRLFVPSAGLAAIAPADGFLSFAVAAVVATRYILYTRFKVLSA